MISNNKMLTFSSLVLISILLIACKQSNETVYTDESGLFSIENFKDPMINIDTLATDLGAIIYHSYLVQDDPTSAKLVSYSDYPLEAEEMKNPYSVIQSAKEMALKSLDIQNILKETKIETKNYQGIEVTGTNNERYFVHYKILLKGNRLYQVGYLKENYSFETQEEIDFIESFKIF